MTLIIGLCGNASKRGIKQRNRGTCHLLFDLGDAWLRCWSWGQMKHNNPMQLRTPTFLSYFLFIPSVYYCSTLSLWCSHALLPNSFSMNRKVCCHLPLLNINGHLQVAGGQLEWSTGKYLLYLNFFSSYSPPWCECNQCATVVLCSQQPNYSSLHPETLLTFFLFFCVPSWFSLGAYLRLMALTSNTVQKQKLNHQ